MIDRAKIAAVLEEIALLKRIAGEVEFKAGAFDRAARAIERMEDLDRRLREQSLADAEGLGMSTARAVHEIVKTGTCSALTELRASIAPGLLQWINIPGLGPKKIRKIHTDLAISSVDELAAACADGRVAGLAGFGEKSAAKILKSVEWIRSNSARCRIDEAEDAAQPFLAALKRVPGLERLEIAGSYRRGLETIGDIDLLAAAAPSAAPALIEAFTTHPDVTEVLGRGDTKASVRSTSGRQIDLRVVAPAAYGSALLYFTGSKEHNVALRGRAREKGLALNEYGLFHLDPAGETDSTRPVPSPTEEAIYQQLGLPWIPPERREGQGEIADYATGRAGELVAQGHIRGVMHLHTTWSDGTAGIEEMARACMERGYEWMVVTDHSRTAAYAGGLSIEKLQYQEREITALNQRLEGRFRILHGIESDILPDGSLDYPDEVLNNLDWVIGSVHARLDMPPDEMLVRLARAASHPLCCMIGHPTGRLLLRREGCPLDVDRLCDLAVQAGVAIEINANPMRLDLDWRPALRAQPKGLLTSINPDAHSTGGIDDIRFGLNIARKAGFTPASVMCTWSADDLLRWRFKRKGK